MGRSFAYSYVMGFSEGIYREYGELNPKTALKALKDGKGIKDFYSSVLIPVFVVLVCIISALSIYNAVRLNLRDRINNLSILRCIGMSSFTTFMLLFSEIIVLVLIACVLGYGFGSLLHMLMLCVLKNGWNIALTPGFTVSAYVKAVTFNPYVISGLTVVAFTVFASLIPLIRLAVKTPIAIKQTNIKLKHKGKTKRIMSVNKTWMRLLSERVSFFSVSIFLMYVFILGVIPFGYTYFHAMSDKQNIEYKYELEDSDLGHYDYTAYKSTLRNMSQFNVESRHYDGINEDAVNNLILSDDFDEVFAISEKYSTKISVKKDDENEDIHNLLGRTALRGQAVSNLTQEDREKSEEYYNSCLEAETEMIRKTGYTDDENIYAVPTVGLTYDRLAELENYVVDGDIDYEKIKNGEEVIIAVYEDDVDTALKVFRTGEYLPLSDVKLNDEEDHFDFYHLDYTKLEAAYEKNVMAPWDAEVTLHSYAFGKRTDIETKIGAIISLDEETANKYLALSENICGGTTEPGKFVPAVITLGTEVFDKWNLNSQKYTNVQVKLADDVDFETADNIWYDTIKDCSGISIQSAYEIRHKIYEKETQTMVIFYFVVISLIISGLICILISLDIKLITLQKEIALLRKIGMSVKQFILYLFIQSSWYPFIGTVLSIIPVTLMQRFFNMIASKNDSGEWEGVYGISTESDIPWYSNLPFRFNLFSYDFIKCLLCTFVVGWFIVVIASLPQIIREYKNKMVKE